MKTEKNFQVVEFVGTNQQPRVVRSNITVLQARVLADRLNSKQDLSDPNEPIRGYIAREIRA